MKNKNQKYYAVDKATGQCYAYDSYTGAILARHNDGQWWQERSFVSERDWRRFKRNLNKQEKF